MTSKYETREDVGKLNEQTSDFFSTNNSINTQQYNALLYD